MKNFPSFVMLLLVFVGCGTQSKFLKDGDGYQVREELRVAGSITLSFQEVHIFRSISVGTTQSERCKVIARDYSKNSGVQVNEASLKLSFDQPEKYCARRNIAKQCETYQYVFTFNCQVETK